MDKERIVIELKDFTIGHAVRGFDNRIDDMHEHEYLYSPKFYYIEDHGEHYRCFDLDENSFKTKYSLKIGEELYNMEDIKIDCKQTYEYYADIDKNTKVQLNVTNCDIKSKNIWWHTLKSDKTNIVSLRLDDILVEIDQTPIFDNETNSEVGFISTKRHSS